jgi:NADH dehydrogenase FAD-containing subunit
MAESNQPGRPTVVVVGGGYGGIAVAKALDETSDVVLVEQKDAFMHNIAALRALVDPSWLPRIFLPYAGLLTNGRVVRDRAIVVDPHRVVTASGEEIFADYIVLATGSRYPFPAKTDLVDAHQAQEQVRQTHRTILTSAPEARQRGMVVAQVVIPEARGKVLHLPAGCPNGTLNCPRSRLASGPVISHSPGHSCTCVAKRKVSDRGTGTDVLRGPRAGR